ncbi:acyltransferase family protein [Amnibacterium endophyticum]|uniref:Acyltransferase family protein n=1 Tax=Amnibacterium endophyticum TaxID=2109337 RepID=A0ABW4LDN5_9MICO
MSTSPPRERTRLDSLTGLRALAACAVFFGHIHGMLGGSIAAYTLPLSRQGYLGVSFFFILSGFVLTWSTRQEDSARSFYRRRFARVYPLHIVTWALAALLLPALGLQTGLAFGVLAGVPLLQAWVPDQRVFYAVNGVAWSLSAEAFFYLVFPLIRRRQFDLRQRTRWALLSGLFLMIVAVAAVAALHVPNAQIVGSDPSGRWLWFLYNFPPTRLLEFAVGCLLAASVRAGLRLPGFWRWFVIALAAYVICGVWPSTFARAALTLAPFCALLVAGASRDLAERPTFFARRRLVRLGEISFAFYLVHQILIHAFSARIPAISSPVIASSVLAAFLGAGWFLAWVLHRFVEVPAEVLLRGGRRSASAQGRRSPNSSASSSPRAADEGSVVVAEPTSRGR